jgi:hypothetical protein
MSHYYTYIIIYIKRITTVGTLSLWWDLSRRFNFSLKSRILVTGKKKNCQSFGSGF